MGSSRSKAGADATAPRKRLSRTVYEEELARLQVELVKLHEWVKHEGLKVLVIFEGREKPAREQADFRAGGNSRRQQVD